MTSNLLVFFLIKLHVILYLGLSQSPYNLECLKSTECRLIKRELMVSIKEKTNACSLLNTSASPQWGIGAGIIAID